jgi:hypothetical protein
MDGELAIIQNIRRNSLLGLEGDTLLLEATLLDPMVQRFRIIS